MRNQQPVQFFDGTYVQSSYRGRTSRRFIRHSDKWAALGFAIVVMCSTAAGAIVVKHVSGVSGDHSLLANAGMREWGHGFADMLW